MSKETFSEKISHLMYQKIKAVESLNPRVFFEKDANFEVALCLAYMTLSKEKIIKKEMKNSDRMGREDAPNFVEVGKKMLKEIDGQYIMKKYNLKPGLELKEKLRQERIEWIKENM